MRVERRYVKREIIILCVNCQVDTPKGARVCACKWEWERLEEIVSPHMKKGKTMGVEGRCSLSRTVVTDNSLSARDGHCFLSGHVLLLCPSFLQMLQSLPFLAAGTGSVTGARAFLTGGGEESSSLSVSSSSSSAALFPGLGTVGSGHVISLASLWQNAVEEVPLPFCTEALWDDH